MFKIKNILLPTDFSNLSLTAANYAISLAEQYNSRIHLLHVLEKVPPILAIRSLDESRESIMNTIEEDANERLNKALNRIKTDKVEIVTSIQKGLDYEEIIRYSKINNIDVIVIATHGRTGLLHTLLGSVAEKVIRYSKVPVLVTTPAEKEK